MLSITPTIAPQPPPTSHLTCCKSSVQNTSLHPQATEPLQETSQNMGARLGSQPGSPVGGGQAPCSLRGAATHPAHIRVLRGPETRRCPPSKQSSASSVACAQTTADAAPERSRAFRRAPCVRGE
ncbi:hypothetical protein ABZP36_009333 [Zizania latifolia]